MKPVRVAVVQAGAVPFDAERSVAKAEKWMADAAAADAKIVVFPEAFVGGYPKGSDFGARVGSRTQAGRTAMYAKGIQIYCAPTVDDRERWAASMRHIALEGRCFVLSACQYIRTGDFPADYDPAWQGNPDEVLIRGGSVIVNPQGEVLA